MFKPIYKLKDLNNSLIFSLNNYMKMLVNILKVVINNNKLSIPNSKIIETKNIFCLQICIVYKNFNENCVLITPNS